MAAEEGSSRIFVGGISPVTTERDLERDFSRFGDILQSQIIRDKYTGHSRGYGFITFADRGAMDESIREMHGKEFGDRVITVNRAEPKSRRDECLKCGLVGHWARDCPFSGRGGPVGGFSSRGPAFGGSNGRYVDDQYEYAPRFGARDRFESREDYIPRDRYVSDRYWAPGDRFAGGDRYSRGSDRLFERDGGGDRYGGGGIGRPIRGGDERRRFRSRPGGPYERPSRSSGGGG